MQARIIVLGMAFQVSYGVLGFGEAHAHAMAMPWHCPCQQDSRDTMSIVPYLPQTRYPLNFTPHFTFCSFISLDLDSRPLPERDWQIQFPIIQSMHYCSTGLLEWYQHWKSESYVIAQCFRRIFAPLLAHFYSQSHTHSPALSRAGPIAGEARYNVSMQFSLPQIRFSIVEGHSAQDCACAEWTPLWHVRQTHSGFHRHCTQTSAKFLIY